MSLTRHFEIRRAEATDAASIAALAAELHAYLSALGYQVPFLFTGEKYARDGFGDRPAFVGLVAESDGGVVGYALLHPGYDTDRGRRDAYLDDLYVKADWRRHGLGRALLSRAAELARSQYAAEALWWGVQEHNDAAFRFYQSIGAKDVNGVRFMSIDIEQLEDQR